MLVKKYRGGRLRRPPLQFCFVDESYTDCSADSLVMRASAIQIHYQNISGCAEVLVAHIGGSAVVLIVETAWHRLFLVK